MNAGSFASTAALQAAAGSLDAVRSRKGLVEYIWVSSDGSLHSKTRVLSTIPQTVADVPDWPVDNATLTAARTGGLRSQLTGQLQCPAGSAILRPHSLFPDPIRGQGSVLAMCSVMVRLSGPEGAVPHPANNRAPCETVLQGGSEHVPMFAFQQQFCLLDKQTGYPLGASPNSTMVFADSQQCGVGPVAVAGRSLTEDHLAACLRSGLDVNSYAAEAVPGQWSYSLGPVSGIAACDQLWVSRYLLLRLSEHYNIVASLHPKPVPGAWDGCGCPISFSTATTRTPGSGFAALQDMIMRLQEHHLEHMIAYGTDNMRQLAESGKSGGGLLNFTIGVEDRAASVSVPSSVIVERCGHLTDRRCAANCDPYLVCMLLTATCCGVPLPQAQPGPSAGPLHGPVLHADELLRAHSPAHSGSSTAHTDRTLDILADLDAEQALQPDTPPQENVLQQETCSQAASS